MIGHTAHFLCTPTGGGVKENRAIWQDARNASMRPRETHLCVSVLEGSKTNSFPATTDGNGRKRTSGEILLGVVHFVLLRLAVFDQVKVDALRLDGVNQL